ncbi:MAG: hypothetical protein AAF251_16605 [Pseudomonadota bacterium]
MQANIDHRAGNALLFKFAVALFVFAFAAFALKVIVDPERLARYTPMVSVHGAIMMGWMAMLASQARLAMTGKLSAHRAAGRWSPLLVIAMVATGLTVSWNLSQESGRYGLLVGNIGVFLTFVPLYVAAIVFARKHKQAEHRQAMLIATLLTLGPANSRVADVLGLPFSAVLPIQIVATVGLSIWLDKASRGGVARSTWGLLGFYCGMLFATAAAFFAMIGPNQ